MEDEEDEIRRPTFGFRGARRGSSRHREDVCKAKISEEEDFDLPSTEGDKNSSKADHEDEKVLIEADLSKIFFYPKSDTSKKNKIFIITSIRALKKICFFEHKRQQLLLFKKCRVNS